MFPQVSCKYLKLDGVNWLYYVVSAFLCQKTTALSISQFLLSDFYCTQSTAKYVTLEF